MRKKRYGENAWWWLIHIRDLMKGDPLRCEFPPVASFSKRDFKSILRLINEGALSIVRLDVDYQGRPRLYYTTTPEKINLAINSGAPR